MLRSTSSHLHRLLVGALAAGVLIAAAGCASDDDSTAAPAATTASQPAAPRQADASALDASDNGTLTHHPPDRRRAIAPGTRRPPASSPARSPRSRRSTQVDPDARQPDGKTVEQVAVALERRLRACGADKAAKRLAKLTG